MKARVSKSVSLLLLLVLILQGTLSFSQEKFTISGTIKDGANGETMIGTNVFLEPLMKGTTTNLYGFFSLTIPKGDYTLKVSFLGYETYSQEISLNANLKLNLDLKTSSYSKDEVVIKGEKADQNTKSSKMSTVEIPIQQVKELPALFGEVDILKTIQLLPGVQSASEGNTGLYVRGGGPD
ncbi:MAG: carboxypeptidase-like regulatory domain-containing protein, partial [Flavobacteriales bacterium]|nr:carboxypeptidase-like regulatory domain-containing protein [Flavobacteriales bacterium]